MSIEGRIRIELSRRPDGTGDARITSTRPLGLTRAFAGKSIAETARTLPLLFSVCGMAQGAAAAEAAEQALGQPVPPETRRIRRILVLAETLREHLLRIATDCARLFGLAPPQEETLRSLRAFESLRRAADPGRLAFGLGARSAPDRAAIENAVRASRHDIEGLVTGEPMDRFQARTTRSEITAWAGRRETPAQRIVDHVIERGWTDAGAIEARILPSADPTALSARLLDAAADGFIRKPVWDGLPHETTALGRQATSPLVACVTSACGPGLLARLMARLVEVGTLPTRLMQNDESVAADASGAPVLSSAAPGPGRGIAVVEAARGRLVHAVEAEDGKVRRYAILAPTEWNFHPEGAAARGLAAIAAKGGSVREIADLFIAALDPCVAYDLEVR